jgi:Spy/CpxP family protein refolding chaperone
MSSDETPVVVTPRRRALWLALLVVAMTFAAGLVAGIAADRMYLVAHERVLPPGGIRFLARHMVRRLDRSLDLTDVQEAQVRAIVDRRTGRMMVKWDEVHTAFHEEFGAAHSEIAAVLTPEQRQKFARMQARWHGRRFQ